MLKRRFPPKSIPAALFLLTILTYGLMLPWTGFYWDDWPFAWIAKFLGPIEFLPAFAPFRPFLGPLFFGTTSLLPPNPLWWQALALILRFALAWAAWWMFKTVWPKAGWQTLTAALLFLVLPGYSQHWVAYTHINQEWIPLFFYILSFGFTAKALRASSLHYEDHAETHERSERRSLRSIPVERRRGRRRERALNARRREPFINAALAGMNSFSDFTQNTLLAVLFLLLGIFPTEYFATQEPLRFLFIYALVSENPLPGTGWSLKTFLPTFKRALKLWLPYLLVWFANAAWLVYYYRFGAYASYDISAAGQFSLLNFSIAMGDALWKAGLYSWVQILALAARSLGNPSTLLTLGVIAASFVLVHFYLRRLDLPESGWTPKRCPELAEGSPDFRNVPHPQTPTRCPELAEGSGDVGVQKTRKNSNWGWQAVMFGLIGILIGRVPSWAAGLPLTLGSINDRFMVSMMIGGGLFIAGLLELIFGRSHVKVFALSLVIALGVGGQFYTANDFRRDWTRQQEIFWQMAWRMPALQPGTVILTHELPLSYETDMGLTAPLNWMYAPDYTRGDLPYALLYTRTRLDGVSLPALEAGQPISFEYRTVDFKGSTSQAVTIIVPPNACLRVLDSVYAGGDTYERQPRFLRDAIPLSDPSLIVVDAETPEMPVALFGQQPPYTWCYYYTKAELARQVGDWERVAGLGDEARAKRFVPGDALEWLPFIEGYTITGDYQAAKEISILAYEDDSRPRKGLCYTWGRILENGQEQVEVKQLAAEMLEKFACAP